MLPFFMISLIKLTVALSSASMASAVEVLLMSVPESRTTLDMDGTLEFDERVILGSFHKQSFYNVRT